jgi:hypothetical protein
VYGIFVSDISAQADSAFTIVFNTILNPKTDGIRFVSTVTKNNHIASNAIINPGAFDYYENGNTSFTGKDAYIMLPDPASDVRIKNNYLARNSDSAKFAADGYSLLQGSPLINAAWAEGMNMNFDYFHTARPYGAAADIGAVEYDPSVAGISGQLISKPILFPNPVKTWLNIKYKVEKPMDAFTGIYSLNGTLVIQSTEHLIPGEINTISINVTNMPPGIYIYSLKSGNSEMSGKFIKSN